MEAQINKAPRIAQTLCVGTVEAQRDYAAKVAQQEADLVADLVAALRLFARLDLTVNSDLWAINADYCKQARAALALVNT